MSADSLSRALQQYATQPNDRSLRAMQQELLSFGFDVSVSGAYDQKTINAVRAIEQAAGGGFTANGRISVEEAGFLRESDFAPRANNVFGQAVMANNPNLGSAY